MCITPQPAFVPETLCWVPNAFVPTHDTQCLHCGRLEEVTIIHPSQESTSSSCSKSLFIECKSQCGAKYCNETCRNNNNTHHDKVCVGQLTSDHPLYKLKIMALEAGDVQQYATIMLALSVVLMDGWDDIIVQHDSSSSTTTIDASELSTIDHLDDEEDKTIAQKTHALLVEIDDDAPTLQEWITLLRYTNQHSTSVYIRSNYAIECEKIANNDESSLHRDQQYDYLLNLTEETSSLIELMDEADQHFPPAEMLCLFKRETCIQHSCIPSHTIKCDSMQDLKYNHISVGKEEIKSEKANHILLTCSRIDNDADLEERTFALKQKGISCDCIRCEFEQNPKSCNCSMDELDSLMALARSQCRYDDAFDIVNAMLKLRPSNGAALLLQSRIVGWQGDFSQRELLLEKAVASMVPTNIDEPISAALREANAYYRRDDDSRCIEEQEYSSCSDNQWNAALEDYVFVGENILNANECKQMVKMAEAYHDKLSGDQKWTTSRHYAVPTTDIPVYQIPKLLSWFNEQLKYKIFPAMEINFEIDSSCSRLRIFDAFLVKYDASTGQKRLPLHNDQSEFSLTIAMNPLDEYEGGGTYFCETNETCKTEVGGVISFHGDLLHAGTVITKGKRYIIVCFIYKEQI